MSSKNTIIEELRYIQNQLKRQEKTARRRFYLSIVNTFIVLSLSVWFALWSSGNTKELGWLIPILFSVAALVIYWVWLKSRQNYHKKFAIIGSILLVVGVATLAKLLVLFPVIICPVRIGAYCLVVLLIALGIILMVLAPGCIRKKTGKK